MAKKKETKSKKDVKKVEEPEVVTEEVVEVAEEVESTPEFEGAATGQFYAARGSKKQGFVVVNKVGIIIESGLDEETAKNRAARHASFK